MGKPSESTVKDTLNTIICETLGVDESAITPDANFMHDLGADELDIVDLVMSCEESFDISIDSDAADRCATVGKFLQLLHSTIGI